MAKFGNCSRKRFWYSFTDLSVGLLLERFFFFCRRWLLVALFLVSGKREVLYNYTTDKFAGSNMSGLLTKVSLWNKTANDQMDSAVLSCWVFRGAIRDSVGFILLLNRKQQ